MKHRIYAPDVEEQASLFPRFDVTDFEGTRTLVQELNEEAIADGAVRLTDERIEEREMTILSSEGHEIPVRVYMPKDRTDPGPGFVNFHGGGFFMGDLESEHDRCLGLSAKGNAVSIGVDYRLAPEFPFPAGVEDCYAALEWVAQHVDELKIDPSKLVIGGGSAGGNLSAAVALMARDRNGPDIAAQLLMYPVIDDRCETPSMIQGDDCYIWNHQNSLDMWNHYIGRDRSTVSSYASPLRAEDLAGLPPAYITSCEHDPLRDEAILYAMRLMAAGVSVELHNYPGTVHGFDILLDSDISRRGVADLILAFRQATSSLPA